MAGPLKKCLKQSRLDHFKAQHTGTNFDFNSANSPFKETGFYEGVVDEDKLIKTLQCLKENGAVYFEDFYYADFLSKETVSTSSTGWRKSFGEFEPYTINSTRKVDNPFKTKDAFGENVTIPLNIKMNKSIGDVKVSPSYGVTLDLDETEASYRINFSYAEDRELQVGDETVSAGQYDEEKDQFENGKSVIIAIEMTTSVFTDFLALMNIMYPFFDPIPFLASRFREAYGEIGTDLAKLENFYEQIPAPILETFSDEQKSKDLLKLLAYDKASWFEDTSSSMLNLLSGFTDFQYLYDLLWNDPKTTKEIYTYINEDHGEDSTEVYCNLLTALCLVYQKIEDVEALDVVKIGGKHHIDSDLFFGEEEKVRIVQRRTVTQSVYVPIHVGSDSGGHYKDASYALDVSDTYYHPMDLVMLQNVDSGEQIIVPALYIKRLSDIEEWELVLDVIFLVINILSIFLSVGILLRGAVGLVRVFAVADIAISSIDIALSNDEIKKALSESGPAGKWFVENWPAISIVSSMGILSIQLAKGILKNGPKVIQYFKNVGNVEMGTEIRKLYRKAAEIVEKGVKTTSGGDALKSFFANAKLPLKPFETGGRILGQTTDYSCVANALGMVLDDLKIYRSELFLMQALKTTEDGARILDIPKALKSMRGVSVRTIARGAKTDRTVTLSTLVKQMKRGGRKAVVSVRTKEFPGHAVVVDKIENGRVFIRDPLPINQGSSYSVLLDDFEQVFNRKFVIIIEK